MNTVIYTVIRAQGTKSSQKLEKKKNNKGPKQKITSEIIKQTKWQKANLSV